MFKRTILALSVAAITLPGLAQAQENATLVMRNGERVSGQLVDLGGVGFNLRVNGQARQIPTNDVAIVDFAWGGNMTDADWTKKTDGSQLLWLRNGETVNGQLYDIGGTSPLKITFKTASGDREVSSSEIGRIVLARPAQAAPAAAAPGATATTGTGIAVSARQAWTSTGLTVQLGETLTFNTTGDVQLSADAADMAAAAGSKSQRYAARSAMPRAFAGALIARIGNGQPFAIGDQTSIAMPAAGQLFLGVNDDTFEDNQGEFRVDIQRSGTPVRRRR